MASNCPQVRDEIHIVGEGSSLTKKLPVEFLEEWKRRPEMVGRYLDFMRDMLRTEKFADVSFTLLDENGETKCLKAHSSILKSKSEFFAVLLSDRWKTNSVDLTGNGVRVADFKIFLEFLYTDQVKFNETNSKDLYHLSNMYQIDDLKLKCEDYFSENITVKNAIPLFNAVYSCNGHKTTPLLEKIIDNISRIGKNLLDVREFLDFDDVKLALIFSTKQLSCSPLSILRFCIRWAKERYGGGKILRNLQEFDDLISSKLSIRLLHEIPELHYYSHHSSLSGNSIKKETNSPENEYFISRYKHIAQQRLWKYRPGRPDRISFRVSEPILLTGIDLYGTIPSLVDYPSPNERKLRSISNRDYRYLLKIYVHGHQHRELLNLEGVGGSNVNEITKTYRISLDSPLYIHANCLYTISVTLSGPDSYFGERGFADSLMICENLPIIFEFEEASGADAEAKLANPTGVPIGQIPKMYFKIPRGGFDDDDIKVL